jgi:hypothetical protein
MKAVVASALAAGLATVAAAPDSAALVPGGAAYTFQVI